MADFITYCNNISPLPQEVIDEILLKLKSKTFLKGDFINKQGQLCRDLFFIEKGLVNHFYYSKSRKYILRFFSENSLFTILDSYINRMPSEFITIALEDTTLTYLDYSDVEELCRNHHSFETFMRKYISNAAINILKRNKEMLEDDATERYNGFVKENGHLLQRISLGDIASYLGISQVSLSRIRAKK
jgi:signal-transduction protein with cAMP-binding, CBS, and nucleotidyltransferase domain